MDLRRFAIGMFAFGLALLTCTPAPAFFHQWKLSEFFSSPDGNVQFIELQINDPFASGEIFAEGAMLTSQSTGKSITFHGTLPGSTPVGKTLLIASPNFSTLPGAVAADFTFDTPNFFNAAGDTIRFFAGGFNYDSRTFASVPTDGIQSRNYFPSETLATNSPKNYSNSSGSVNLAPGITPTGDYNGDHEVNAADYVIWRDTFGDTASPPGNGADGDKSGTIGDGDYTFWKSKFGNAVPGAGASIGPVPEPGMIAMIAAALCLIGLRRTR
jgi:hypothetical protein